MIERGWEDMTHVRRTITVKGQTIFVAGVDDPHLKRDRYVDIAGTPDPQAALRLGITHSPEPRVLDPFAADGYDFVMAGHTHGGQLRFPLIGPVVCPSWHGTKYACGYFYQEPTLMHVSRGTGSLFPLRLDCPPEITRIVLNRA